MNIGTRINDAMQLYNFDKKDGAITGPKLKFPKAIGQRPIFGDQRSKTRWSVFLKGE